MSSEKVVGKNNSYLIRNEVFSRAPQDLQQGLEDIDEGGDSSGGVTHSCCKDLGKSVES